ncbi:hypothetical protein MPUL_28010 [Mycolicibacterium pulveris]|uniref:Short-chain dehydrogenase n=1 Tax=Mycolicibacterium pulveris TaxID=36813 RepID=A0A7I7ULA9_MYCPV|nr:SDR family NAD(P)-dependent oxidoreductase [Mycolicibacterium pulveris]BBY81643.1 hypothetical protein MPUL_28010 [Mycolicibacterium pulveris]
MTGPTSALSGLLSPGLPAGTAAFVTGGGSGINLAIAHGLASVGADVAICGRSQEKLDAAASQLRDHGVRVAPVAADVRDDKSLAQAIDTAAETFGRLDTVVAGAAGNFFASAETISANGFRTVVDIDLLGSFNTARAAFDTCEPLAAASFSSRPVRHICPSPTNLRSVRRRPVSTT